MKPPCTTARTQSGFPSVMIDLTASPSEISRTAPSVDALAAPPAAATRNVRRLGARARALTSKSSARIGLTSRAPAALVLSLLARATAARRPQLRVTPRPPGVTLLTTLWLGLSATHKLSGYGSKTLRLLCSQALHTCQRLLSRVQITVYYARLNQKRRFSRAELASGETY